MLAPLAALRGADAPNFERLKYGLFVHHGWGGTAYALTKNPDLSVPKSIAEVADPFDVQRFVDEVASFKVEYVVFTAWHADMNAIFPSKAMDKWRGPGHAAKRDVLGAVVKAFKTKGIPLYLYVHPSDGHDMRKEDQERLGWNGSINTPSATAWAPGKFTKWNDFVNDVFDEMCGRYGKDVAGYWVDGGWDHVDRERIKKTVWKYNPQAEFVSGMDCANPVDAWKIYAPIEYRNVNTWPGWECQVGILQGGCWWSTGGTAKLSPEHIVKYTVLQAGINRQGGGACWAADPYTDGTWEPNVKEYLIMAGALLEPIAEAVKNTYASTAFPTPQGSKIATLRLGVVATRSVDGGHEYIHVLRPPEEGTTLRLPPPADGRRFTEAVMLRTGRKANFKQDAQGVTIEVPWQDAWDPIDTVIKLTGQRGYGNVAAGKGVTASSSHKDWPVANAVNGDRSRGFSTDGSENPSWIIIDLGKNMALEQIHLYPRVFKDVVGYNFPVDFTIQVSPDKATWKTVLTKTNYVCTRKAENPDGAISKMAVNDPSATVQIFPLPASTEARYVKIEATKLKDENRMQFMEIEVYGVDPNAGPASGG
jgi:hypothetical protein